MLIYLLEIICMYFVEQIQVKHKTFSKAGKVGGF